MLRPTTYKCLFYVEIKSFNKHRMLSKHINEVIKYLEKFDFIKKVEPVIFEDGGNEE